MLIQINKDVAILSSHTEKVNSNLEEHMRRTNNLEGRMEVINTTLGKHERLFWMGAGAVTLLTLLGACAAFYHNVVG